jgi:acid stress-induced BolA-like protein IbaG/YrbA
VDVKDKIAKVLSRSLEDAYIRLEEDDGISGFVVSPRFQGMSSVDRQALIEDALSDGPDPLTPEERRHVLMIAGLTPVEFDTVGARVRVHRVKELAGGTVEVLIHGRLSDAEYVRGALNNQKGVRTTEPRPTPGALGILMSFRANGTAAVPLTKEKVIRVLKNDPYIEVIPKA